MSCKVSDVNEYNEIKLVHKYNKINNKQIKNKLDSTNYINLFLAFVLNKYVQGVQLYNILIIFK